MDLAKIAHAEGSASTQNLQNTVLKTSTLLTGESIKEARKMWKTLKKKRIEKPVLIEGLPGIGNVGKIAADLLIDELKAIKIAEYFSYDMPNSVFVNEDNLVELPKIELWHKKWANQDFLFLSGDAQPNTERASYEFTDSTLQMLAKSGCEEIITLGGIGLSEIPKKPTVYCTGNEKKYVIGFKQHGAKNNIYGVVGPIIGVSGLMLGMAKRHKIKAAALLAETYGHPIYIGLNGAKEMLKLLSKKYDFKLDLKELNKEIQEMEKDAVPRADDKPIAKKYLKYKDTSYIG